MFPDQWKRVCSDYKLYQIIKINQMAHKCKRLNDSMRKNTGFNKTQKKEMITGGLNGCLRVTQYVGNLLEKFSQRMDR